MKSLEITYSDNLCPRALREIGVCAERSAIIGGRGLFPGRAVSELFSRRAVSDFFADRSQQDGWPLGQQLAATRSSEKAARLERPRQWSARGLPQLARTLYVTAVVEEGSTLTYNRVGLH